MVGDDDQSIYKFQGANVENVYTFFQKHETHIQLISLTENYRSSQKILNVSNHIIEKNQERLVGKIGNVSKDIIASNPTVSNYNKPVIIFSYEDSNQELIDTCNNVEELIKNGVSPNEIAILFKEHKQAEPLIPMLEGRNIPYLIARNHNVLEQTLIKQLIQLLRYVELEISKAK